jgi:hypothetical protein
MWNLVSVRLEIVLISTHRIELLRDVGHVKSHFDPFRDGVSVGVR